MQIVMNWGAFDLNLLIVFDAVMQERSVTRAGSRIGLSQPAMSHALNRLRHMLKDELFVRTPAGMVPTPRAEALAQPLRNALNEMQLALEPTAFEPAASDRRFVLAVNNYAAVVIVPPLVAAARAAAPAIHLDLRPSGTLDIVERLDRGDLDLAIIGGADQGERFAAAALLEDHFVMVMRRGHPCGRATVSPAEFAALPQGGGIAKAYVLKFTAPGEPGATYRLMFDMSIKDPPQVCRNLADYQQRYGHLSRDTRIQCWVPRG